MKKLIIVAAFLSALVSNAQKTAFISETKILEATPGYTRAVKEMDTIKSVYAKNVKEDQDKLSKKINNLLAPYKLTGELALKDIETKLSESDKKKFELLQEEAKLQDKQIKNLEEEYLALYKTRVGVLLEKVNTIINSYCKANKIDILYKKEVMDSAMAYISPSLDITEQIIVKLK